MRIWDLGGVGGYWDTVGRGGWGPYGDMGSEWDLGGVVGYWNMVGWGGWG